MLVFFAILSLLPDFSTFAADGPPTGIVNRRDRKKTNPLDEASAYGVNALERLTEKVAADQAQLEQNKITQEEFLKNLAATKAEVKEIAAQAPKSAAIQTSAARVYRQAGDYQTAFSYVNQAIALAPKDSWPLLNRGIMHFDQGDFPSAARDTKKALALDPSNRAAFSLYKLSQGRAPRAGPSANAVPVVEEEQKAVNQLYTQARLPITRPAGFSESVSRTRQAETALKLDNYEEMHRQSSLGIAKMPENPKAYMQRAFASLFLKRYDEVIADANKGLSLQPNSSALLSLRAAAFNETVRPKQALEDAKRAVALAPRDPFAWVQKGLAREKLGEKPEEYLADLKQAAELSPDFEHFYTEALARRGTGGGGSDSDSLPRNYLKSSSAGNFIAPFLNLREIPPGLGIGGFALAAAASFLLILKRKK